MQDSPDAKKPCKGILKTSSSFDRPNASYRKSAKFDELNVLQTYHPLDKDYGHMKIEEPKTPFNYAVPDIDPPGQLDADLLAEKLRIAADTQSPCFGDDDNLSDDDFPENDEEKVRRVDFERRRKAHYNEFEAVRMARKLIEEEQLDDEEDVEDCDYLSLSHEGEAEESKSKTETEYAEEAEEENTGADTGSSTETENVVLARPMDVDSEDASNPCAGRQQQQ